MAIGGGVGGLIILLIAMFTGFDLSSLGLGTGDTGSDVTTNDPALQEQFEESCQTGANANERVDCLVAATVNSLDAYWESAAPAAGASFAYPGIVLYDSVTSTPCGTASNQTGPFYCPPDQTIYVDTSFFDILVTQFGSSDGQLAQEYVIAHEYGHHIQTLLGVFDVASRDGTGADSDSVKVELMADCLAGVWANHAATIEGGSFLEPLTKQDIADALSAASSVGDDHIQQATQGSVDQDSFTHGSSAQREDYFLTGYRSGDANSCDYFEVVG
jgi:predicted metalloprotease